jgi:hypothetical protein
MGLLQNSPIETVKKGMQRCSNGTEDSSKETEEGCLLSSIIKFFEHFDPFACSKNLLQLVKEQVL